MIVRFYKRVDKGYSFFITRNLSIVPRADELVTFSGQTFIVDTVRFDGDTSEYHIYLSRNEKNRQRETN